MKGKIFTHGITFFVSGGMYEMTKRQSDELRIGVSDFLRGLIENYFREKGNESPGNVDAIESQKQGETR